MSDRIGVLHVINGLETGGSEMALLRLLTACDRERIRHRVIALNGMGPIVGPRIRELGIPVTALELRSAALNPMAVVRQMLGCLVCEFPTPVCTVGWLYGGALAACAIEGLRGRGVPVLWNLRHTPRSPEAEGRSTLRAIRLCGLFSTRANTIICNSKSGILAHEALGYRPKAWVHMPNGFNADVFCPDTRARSSVREECGLPPDTFLVGLVARVHPHKGHDVFLEAALEVAVRHPSVHFVLAGRGAVPDHPLLNSRIGTGPLAGRIHCLGERADVARITAALDIAVSASYTEAFSNTLGEAMGCGVPCVATDVGDSKVLLGEGGRVVPPGHALAMATAILELLNLSGSKRQAIGMAGRQRLVTQYSLAGSAVKYQDLFMSFLEH